MALLIGCGDSILTTNGEESLAQVNRWIASPKLKNLKRARLLIFVYCMVFTSLVYFSAAMRIPDNGLRRALSTISSADWPAFLGVALVGASAWLCYKVFAANATTAGLVFLVEILLFATGWGLFEALSGAVAAVLLLNYLFLPPVGHFTIADPPPVSERYLIAARVGGEIRGVARPRPVAALGEHRLFLMIRSNRLRGETVTFEAYDPDLDAILPIGETVEFQADDAVGRVSAPFALRASRAAISNRPSAFLLGQLQPNPFRAARTTPTIQYALPREEHVKIKVFDVRGRLVRTLVDAKQPAGWHAVQVDARGLASGIYMYRMQAGSFSQTHRMVVL